MKALATPQRLYHRPRFFGLDHLQPDRPTLYVGNHTILGALDAPLIVERIYRETGRVPRVTAAQSDLGISGWSELLTRFFVVDASRAACDALMREGQSVVVFPGGGRDSGRGDEPFELVWKRRVGFARSAIAHGYSVTPFASVGPEQCYAVRADGSEIKALPLFGSLEGTSWARPTRRGERLSPLTSGLLGSTLPKPARFYIGFGEAIDARDYAGREGDIEVVFALRRRVRVAMEQLVAQLRERRAERGVSRTSVHKPLLKS